MRKVRKGKNAVYHFSLFEKRRKTSELPFRLGAELHNYKTSVNLNLPFLVRLAAYSGFAEAVNKKAYGIEHICDRRLGNWFRTGFDRYKGEFAILLPFLKIWFQCDYLSNNFSQFNRFSIFVFLLKIKWTELTFRIGLIGFRFSFRIAGD